MQNPKQIVCKRVLGLEGDEVRIPQSTQLGPGRTVLVWLTLNEPFPPLAHKAWPAGTQDLLWQAYRIPHATQVPKGHVWLQGDNFINSTDSRHYGPEPYALLRGRAFLKVHHACPTPHHLSMCHTGPQTQHCAISAQSSAPCLAVSNLLLICDQLYLVCFCSTAQDFVLS